MTFPRHRAQLALAACVALLVGLVATVTPAAAFPGEDSTVFINELHYDNAGTDTGEFIEVAGPAGTDLSGWSLVLYNGSSTQLNVYGTEALAGTLADAGEGYGLAVVELPQDGFQNGSPDGVALVNDGTVVQFLSYEGSFTAANGPAAGLTSTDIGVSEPATTAIGQSLQLTGTGTTAGAFTWSGPAAESPGSVNTGQSFGGGGTTGQPLPLFEGFDIDDCTATGWQVVSVDTDQANSWSCNASFSNADVNGFGDVVPADEWLIAPALNMEAQTGETLDFRSLTPGTDAWRIRPTDADYDFTADNPRTATPDEVGGSLQVASFNVLNYFTTLDDGPGVCGPSGDLDCRGANSAEELVRQRDKIVAALAAMDADVVGLIEIENDDGTAAADLVAGLNAVIRSG